MRRLLLCCFFILLGSQTMMANPLDGFNRIARINELKKEAANAYQNKDFEKAKQYYITLKDSFSVTDDKILLNLANSYFHSDGKTEADKLYTDLLASENKEIRSKASSQRGVMQFEKQELSKALISFKNALKNNPANEEARYNYELVKKMLEENPDQDKQNQDKSQDKDNKDEKSDDNDSESSPNQEGGDKEDDPEGDPDESEGDKSESGDKQEGDSGNKNQKDKENKDQQERGDPEKSDDENAQDQQEQDGQGEEGKDKEQDQKKMNQQQLKEMLDQMDMTEETAKSILEAMKNSDIQYIQQMRRKSPKKPDSSKPDW